MQTGGGSCPGTPGGQVQDSSSKMTGDTGLQELKRGLGDRGRGRGGRSSCPHDNMGLFEGDAAII